MTPRDRLLTALNNEKPDRLPCQVHGWMDYYLNTYLNGMDQFKAYEQFDMDAVIYVWPKAVYNEKDQTNWIMERTDLGKDTDGNVHWIETFKTAEGELVQKLAQNEYTAWITEYLVKTEADFELWEKYAAIPSGVDWTPVIEAKNKIGNKGIVRGYYLDFGPPGPWACLCTLYDTEQAIMDSFDKPDWLHYALKAITEKKVKTIEAGGKCQWDIVETGGGAASSTLISPKMHEEFSLPYDRQIHDATHAVGGKTSYHLCGGLMPLLDMVVENGSDGLETMTPPAMGGDCDLAKANQQVGDKLFFIGGFDQNAGFEKATPRETRELVLACHESCPDGGYICSPSDHFFFGDPANVQAFVDACKECTY